MSVHTVPVNVGGGASEHVGVRGCWVHTVLMSQRERVLSADAESREFENGRK